MVWSSLVLFALALELGLVAFWVGGVGWVLLWPALAFLMVAVAYVAQSPAPFGKVGLRFRTGRRVLLFPYSAVVTVLWHVLRIVERRAPWNRLTPELVIGRRLLGHEYPPGTASVVDLTCELAAVLPEDDVVTYLSVPILDAGWPEPARLLATVRTIRDLPRPIYLHCAQGHGRTALVAAAILLAEGDAKTAEEALGRVRAVRPGVRVNGGQRRVLEQLAGLLTFPDLQQGRASGRTAPC